MRLLDFSLGGLRVFAEAECVLGPGINWFVGSNGAGKTSVLEAVSLLALGRSFRSSSLDPVLQTGASRWWVRGRVQTGQEPRERHLAVGRIGRGALERRVDGFEAARLADLASALPILVFEPTGSEIVLGGSERRRRLLDWGVFHVEQVDIEVWSRYQRALKQRNAALRSGDLESAVAWEGPLSEAGEEISRLRSRFADVWFPMVEGCLGALAPGQAGLELSLSRGWGRDHASLSEALASGRSRDLGLGYTYSGPHRADLALRMAGSDVRERVSRGQARTVALSLLMAMGQCFQEKRGQTPVMLLDDVCAELDPMHQTALFALLAQGGFQALVSSVALPPVRANTDDRVFHVEQARITPLLYSAS